MERKTNEEDKKIHLAIYIGKDMDRYIRKKAVEWNGSLSATGEEMLKAYKISKENEDD